ncbi:hypothetical protein ACFW1A_01145 [Kitasatospora sp. NPDC058965]|uniref:hypothetical protein n=1 Tax=Kitasatospora sp. NPDC058965 TaxID=3346682 RepID=UPI0036B83FEF
MNAVPVYLSSLAAELGDKVALEDLGDAVVTRELDRLQAEGLRHCRVSGQQPFRLAARAAARSLADGPGAPSTAVYCAESPAQGSFCYDVWDFLQELGRPALPTVALAGNACGNIPPALRIARNAVLADPSAVVLLATTNKREHATRFMADGQTVNSDGAAACLVSATPPRRGFRLLATSESIRADLPTGGSPLSTMRAVLRGVSATVTALTDAPSVGAADFDLMITGHYGESVRRLYATAAGVDFTTVHSPLVADLGHCSAGDLLLGLADAQSSPHLHPGARILLLGTSPRSWSCAALEYVRTDTPHR